jgi:diguanylate cyclase (GGDEF)-like protein
MGVVLVYRQVLDEIVRRSSASWAGVIRQASETHGRLRKHIGSPRVFISRLGNVITCITIFLPPVAFALLSAYDLRQDAVEQASLGARHVEMQLTMDRAKDSLTQVSISVVHATARPNSTVVASWLTDKDGFTLMFRGESAWWPELKAHMPVSAGGFTGHFHVAMSTRRVFLGTLYVGTAFLLLGFAAYYCFRRLPLASLDDALQQLESKQVELIAQKHQLEMQNFRFDAALNNMSQGLCMFDGERRLVVCNARYIAMYNLPPELTLPGTPLHLILENRFARSADRYPEDYRRDLASVIGDNRVATKIVELLDGRVFAICHQPMPGGGWIATHEDITEQRRVEARAAHLAKHDLLTDLPNRLHLRERLRQELDASEGGAPVAVLSLDLDRFKDINEAMGHAYGDELLKAAGARIADCVGSRDLVARLGGDEYSILQIGAEQPIAATTLAARVLEAFAVPFTIEGQPVTIGASLGIAVSPGDGESTDLLLKNADLALRLAKSEGRGVYRFFEREMDAHMQARRKLQLDMHKAIGNGEFELNYQPLVNLERDEVSALEALLRWNHPERGRVSPAEFIPLAEENGLIVPLGEWALRQACSDAAQWPQHIKVAVNLSAVQFKSRHLVETVFSALAASGLSPHRLELEVTESVLLQNNEVTLATLHQLRALGVRIAMDDFGTGYSSLSYLRSFPFDKIKIDRCFVADLADATEDSRAILRAVAGLGLSLGIATTAEGVETQEQVDRVRQEGCTEMQGYYFSPPLPIADIRRLFLDENTRAVSAA